MTRQVNNIRGVSQIKRNITPVRKMTERRDTTDDSATENNKDSVENQVAAVKKLPQDRIAVNESTEKAASLNKRLTEALSANELLKDQSEKVKKENTQLRRTVELLKTETTEARRAASANERLKSAADKEINELKWKLAVMQEKLEVLQEAVEEDEDFRLDTEKTQQMLQQFKEMINSPLPGLEISGVELRLKVAMARHGNGDLMRISEIDRSTERPGFPGEFIIRMIQAG